MRVRVGSNGIASEGLHLRPILTERKSEMEHAEENDCSLRALDL